jgi:hypothetical protein
MRDFSKVSPAVWQSNRFNGLPSDDGRYLYIYLLTNEHQTAAGCYRLPDGYACTDLRWLAERYARAREELVASDMIVFDATSRVIGIKRWFKHNPPMSKDHLTGIVRYLTKLPSDEIATTFEADANEAWEAIMAARAAEEARKRKAAPGAPQGRGGGISNHLETPYLTKGR